MTRNTLSSRGCSEANTVNKSAVNWDINGSQAGRQSPSISYINLKTLNTPA